MSQDHKGVMPWTWGGVPREGWACSPCSPGQGWAADRSTPPPDRRRKHLIVRFSAFNFIYWPVCGSGSKTRFHSGWGIVSDPYLFDTDPDPIRIQGFDVHNLEKFAAEKKIGSKTTIYLSLGLNKGRPSYNHQKENIQHFKKLNFI